VNLLIFGLVVIGALLAGVLLIAHLLSVKYGDDSASYRLFAIRDRLVATVVFDGVDRDDPWFDALYENVNSILIHSNLLSGPSNWPVAEWVGRHLAKHPHEAKKLRHVPTFEPPADLQPVIVDINNALDELRCNHIGIITQFSAHRRELARIQRDKAKEFQSMFRASGQPFPARV